MYFCLRARPCVCFCRNCIITWWNCLSAHMGVVRNRSWNTMSLCLSSSNAMIITEQYGHKSVERLRCIRVQKRTRNKINRCYQETRGVNRMRVRCPLPLTTSVSHAPFVSTLHFTLYAICKTLPLSPYSILSHFFYRSCILSHSFLLYLMSRLSFICLRSTGTPLRHFFLISLCIAPYISRRLCRSSRRLFST